MKGTKPLYYYAFKSLFCMQLFRFRVGPERMFLAKHVLSNVRLCERHLFLRVPLCRVRFSFENTVVRERKNGKAEYRKIVIPAKAGIQVELTCECWIPAPDRVRGRLYAGMTTRRNRSIESFHDPKASVISWATPSKNTRRKISHFRSR